MLEKKKKSICVTVNSAVYQNVTVSTSWIDSIHICVQAAGNRFKLLVFMSLSPKGTDKTEIVSKKIKKTAQIIRRQNDRKKKKPSTCKLTYKQN